MAIQEYSSFDKEQNLSYFLDDLDRTTSSKKFFLKKVNKNLSQIVKNLDESGLSDLKRDKSIKFLQSTVFADNPILAFVQSLINDFVVILTHDMRAWKWYHFIVYVLFFASLGSQLGPSSPGIYFLLNNIIGLICFLIIIRIFEITASRQKAVKLIAKRLYQQSSNS